MSASTAPVSIIVPNYNHADFLPGALEGIVSQTLLPREVIILDDASTDNSREVILEWQARHPGLIRAVFNETNLGMLRNQEKGYGLSTQPYVYFHSSDDLIRPRCVETCVRLLEAHPQAGLAASRVVTFRGDPAAWVYETDRWVPEEGYHGPGEIADNLATRFFTGGQVMYRRGMIEEAGGFHVELAGFCDWLWLHSAAFRHGIVFSPEVLCLFRLVPDSQGHQSLERNRLRAISTRLLEILHEPRNADLLPFFARSGILHHLGIPMAEAVLGDPRWWTPQVLMLVQQNLHTWSAHNDRIRLQGFSPLHQGCLEEELEPLVAEAVFACHRRNFQKVAFYGASQHTRTVLPIWRRRGGPEVRAVFITRDEGLAEFEGIPAFTLDTFDPDTVDAIVLSSRPFELDMAEACRERFPHKPRIGLWHPAEASFLP